MNAYHMITTIALFGIYSKELKTCTHTQTCMWTCIADLFIMANAGKQPSHLLVGEWAKKLVHPDNGILVSTKKKRAIKAWKDTKET